MNKSSKETRTIKTNNEESIDRSHFELWTKEERQEKINEYMKSLDEKTKIAYKIAKEHLGSSFDIERSVDFNKWLSKNK